MSYNPFPSRFAVPNPQAPFNGEIPNGLQPGRQIVVRGCVTPYSQQFRIDLLTVNGSIAFHVNPRFNVGQIVRNTDCGGWGPEERHGPFPFRRAEPFELIISTESDHFKVAVNGQHNFDYNFRVPIQDINRLAVLGDVECHEISFIGGFTPIVSEIHNPPVPGSIPLVGGLEPGKLIQIIGHVPPEAGRFQVNLQSGPYNEPNDIHLHFNPRWNDPYSPEPIVVRTHRRHGGWGGEDRGHSPFPFARGANFEMLLYLDQNEWKVAVNGQHFISYPHQFEFSVVDHIGFVGDVIIMNVKQYN